MPHSKPPFWLPQSQLAPLPDTSTLDWLFDEGSLTRRLIRLSNEGFSVTPLFEGWPDDGIAPGTLWQDVPEDWLCPDCGVGKMDFEMIEIN